MTLKEKYDFNKAELTLVTLAFFFEDNAITFEDVTPNPYIPQMREYARYEEMMAAVNELLSSEIFLY